MSTAVVPSQANVPACKYATNDSFQDFVKSPYLGRVQLITSSTNLGKAGKFPMNHWALIEGSSPPEDLTTDVEVFPLTWRPRAMNTKGDTPISKFNPSDPEFKKIQALADVPNSKCMYGPEFLVWLPTSRQFASLYLTSQGLKAIAKFLLEKLGKHEPVRLGSRFHDKGQNPRQVPTAVGCPNIFAPSDMPSAEELAVQIAKFNTPPESLIEEVADEPGRDR